MVNKEIFILTKHSNFQADYIEKIPVYKRRYFLHLLEKEIEEVEKEQNKVKNTHKKPRR